MDPISVYDARNSLSRLVTAAGAGESIVIAKRGKPVARLVRVDAEPQHSAGAAAQWLTANPSPSRAARKAEGLDEQIRGERESWE